MKFTLFSISLLNLLLLSLPVQAFLPEEQDVSKAVTKPKQKQKNTSNADANIELRFWNSIKSRDNSDDYRAYLAQYPRGRFALLAHIRLKSPESIDVRGDPTIVPMQQNKSTYSIGGKGPGGGIVFSLDSSGHGLEAQPADYTRQPGDNNYGDKAFYTWQHAMTAGSSYGSGWHLPTKDELNLLFLQKSVVSGFFDNHYWSSTENGSFNAWIQHLYHGNQDYDNKYLTNRVRAVRAF
jgi:hypothetical protein